MKRFLVIILLLLFPLVYASNIFSQGPGSLDYNRAYQDYVYNFSVYRKAHSDYILAKGQYLSYKTLKSKNNALQKTLIMLQARDETIITYLTTLRFKLAETEGVSPFERQTLFNKIDNEVVWFEDHKVRLSSAGNLEDLIETSGEVEERFASTQVLFYQALTAILAGKENGFREKLSDVIEDVKDKVAEIRQNKDKNTRKIERWILDAENRLTRSQEKQFTAQSLIAEMEERMRDKPKGYSKVQTTMKESHQYLKEASSFLKEIIEEIKSADLI